MFLSHIDDMISCSHVMDNILKSSKLLLLNFFGPIIFLSDIVLAEVCHDEEHSEDKGKS